MTKKATPKPEPKNPSTRSKRGKVQAAKAPEPAPVIATQAKAQSLDRIRERAYQIFRAGANPRDPVADWFQAERELSGEART